MLNSDQNDEECDTTKDDTRHGGQGSNAVDNIIFFLPTK
jgi:hypothetical protein